MSDFDYHAALSPCRLECNQRGKVSAKNEVNIDSQKPENDVETFCTSCGRTRSEVAHWFKLGEPECLAILQKAAARRE